MKFLNYMSTSVPVVVIQDSRTHRGPVLRNLHKCGIRYTLDGLRSSTNVIIIMFSIVSDPAAAYTLTTTTAVTAEPKGEAWFSLCVSSVFTNHELDSHLHEELAIVNTLQTQKVPKLALLIILLPRKSNT